MSAHPNGTFLVRISPTTNCITLSLKRAHDDYLHFMILIDHDSGGFMVSLVSGHASPKGADQRRKE